MDEHIKRITDITENAKKKAIDYARPKRIVAGLQFIACLTLALGVNMVSFEFDFSAFYSPRFYISTCCTTIGYVLIFKAAINWLYPKTENRDEVLRAKESYAEENGKKELDFKDYLAELNEKNKIELYVMSINHKIYKLEKKSIKSRKERTKNKCTKRIEALKLLITPEYIEKNLNLISVKQRIIYLDDFTETKLMQTSGLMPTNTYKEELNKRSFKSVYLFVLSTALLSVGIFTQNQTTISLVVSTVATVISCIFRVSSAIMQADEIYDQTITKSYIDRTRILKEYQAWRLEKPEVQKKNHDEEIENIKKEYDAKLQVGINNALEAYIKKTKPEA